VAVVLNPSLQRRKRPLGRPLLEAGVRL